MTPDDLTTICRALYGTGWQSALAHDLGISNRTVRRWVAGQNPVPEWVFEALEIRQEAQARMREKPRRPGRTVRGLPIL